MPSFNCSDTEIESDSGISRFKKQKNKPLMEKKRRARINRSLSQLKQILIQDEHKNSSQHSKWEKADILEMAVEYLQQLRNNSPKIQIPAATSPPATVPPPTVTPGSNPGPPLLPVPYPMLHQYMAYHQLAQLSMYSSMMSLGLPAPLGIMPKDRSADK